MKTKIKKEEREEQEEEIENKKKEEKEKIKEIERKEEREEEEEIKKKNTKKCKKQYLNKKKFVSLQRLSKQEQRPSFTWTMPSKQDVLSETQNLNLGAKRLNKALRRTPKNKKLNFQSLPSIISSGQNR